MAELGSDSRVLHQAHVVLHKEIKCCKTLIRIRWRLHVGSYIPDCRIVCRRIERLCQLAGAFAFMLKLLVAAPVSQECSWP